MSEYVASICFIHIVMILEQKEVRNWDYALHLYRIASQAQSGFEQTTSWLPAVSLEYKTK